MYPPSPNALVPVPANAAAPAVLPPAARLVAAFLSGRSPATLRSYRKDLDDFAAWSGAGSAEDAARLLLAAPHGAANEAALN
jgi:hypothetical protein